MGLSVETGIPVITVFIQGLLSFFSPCVLPLVPLYVSYLAGGTKTVDENGNVHYPRKKVMVNTLFFVLGVSFTFFLLGFGFTAMGRFFTSNRAWFARVSGIIMILFGLYQLGLFGRSETIEREHRLPFRLDRFSMNPLVALMDSLRRAYSGQRAADGIFLRIFSQRIPSCRCLYTWICHSLPSCRYFHRLCP